MGEESAQRLKVNVPSHKCLESLQECEWGSNHSQVFPTSAQRRSPLPHMECPKTQLTLEGQQKKYRFYENPTGP